MSQDLTAPLSTYRRSHDEIMRAVIVLSEALMESDGIWPKRMQREVMGQIMALRWAMGDQDLPMARTLARKRLLASELCPDERIAEKARELAREWAVRS